MLLSSIVLDFTYELFTFNVFSRGFPIPLVCFVSTIRKSLIRVFNSKIEVEEIADMLSLADPPVITEIYDNRKDEILS